MASAERDRVDGDGSASASAGTQAADTATRDQLFNQFYDSTDFLDILRIFQSLCAEIGVDPNQYDGFYSSLKEKLTTWKAGALWQLLDARARLPEYQSQGACAGKRVLVVGAGPVGLRGAIEAALLGASVDLVEKRAGFTRNNSLHLWPFLITDLRNLGAKKFYGKFASGTIDHICIRILQSVLLKVCLLLGVKVHPGVTFTGLVEPKNTNSGWSITTNPASCPASSYHYDIILAVDGKQNSLPGFRTKEFRAKLALAITANFVNHNTKQESSVPEISGVAYVYRQEFFNSMAKELGIALENIVYYKDETHYFVMTAKKPSLIKRGVIKKDENDPRKLLAPENVDKKALERYAIEATAYATDGALGSVEFEKNHRGENDVALFDFTSLFASENAARIIERKGKRILLCVAGDSLLEPFWPTGSGCARGFLGAFDAAWMMKKFANGEDPITLIEEREAILYLLPQTTPERLQKNLAGYTIDPRTRYVNLSELVPPGDVTHLYDSDDPNVVNALKNRAQSTSVRRSTKGTKTKAVPTTQEESKPKRSRSTEGLASKSASIESPFEASAKESVETGTAKSTATLAAGDGESGVQRAQKARHFFQKTSANTAVTKSTETKEKVKKDTKKKIIAPSDSKPPLPSNAKENKKKFGPSGTTTVTAVAEHTSSGEGAKKSSKKSKVSSSVRGKRASPPASPELHGDSKKKKKHSLFGGGKGRSRSESPERTPKSSKKTSAKDPVGSHPLEAATSLKSLDRESAGVAGEEHVSGATNVLDMIKQYDKKDELAKNQTRRTGHEKMDVTSLSDSSQQGKGSKGNSESAKKEASGGKGGKGQKEKEKEKASKDDKKKEGKEGSSSRGLLSFFKRGKGHDDGETSGGKQHKKKTKKEKEKESKQTGGVDSSSRSAERGEEPHLFSIKGRIERLKESGVYTDGSEETDSPVVLVSVTKHEDSETGNSFSAVEEEEKEDCGSPDDGEEGEGGCEEGEGDGERVEIDFGVEEEEVFNKKGELSDHEEKESEVAKGGEGEVFNKKEGLSEEKESEVAKGGEGEEEEEESETLESVDRVKRLQGIFQAQIPKKSTGFGRSYSTSQANRSKEIDLSDLLDRDAKGSEHASHPLWLARIIQSLNKCLENLRKENDVMVAKTALVILSTIINNVQLHPDDDVYRRVRVSSDRFHTKVWQYSNARQFLARAGWVEIDDFIVLPIDSKVDIPKRILDKHLNILNQMLWSMQLELPDSPGVIKKRPPRERALTLMKRNSYATLIVEESLEQIEQDKKSMAAAAMSKRRGSESSPSLTRLQGGEREKTEAVKEERVTEDYLNSLVVPESRTEEVQTMKAASAARSIWLQREVKKEETVHEKKYRLILETELYDLPPPPPTTSADRNRDARSRSKSPEDEPVSFIVGGGGQAQSDKREGLTHRDRRVNKTLQVEALAEVPEEEVEDGSGMENGNETAGTESTGVEERLRKLTMNKSSSLSQQLCSEQSTRLADTLKEATTSDRDEKESRRPPLSSEVDHRDEPQPLGEAGMIEPGQSTLAEKKEDTREGEPSTNSSSLAPPGKKLHDSASSDQLRQLLLSTGGQRSTSPNLITGASSPSGIGAVEDTRESKSPSPTVQLLPEEQQRSKVDAQHSTDSAIKSGRLEYEKLAIQAAAETRQKWKETEASLASNKEERTAL